MSINWNMNPHPVTEGLIDQCCIRERFYYQYYITQYLCAYLPKVRGAATC